MGGNQSRDRFKMCCSVEKTLFSWNKQSLEQIERGNKQNPLHKIIKKHKENKNAQGYTIRSLRRVMS